jgi:sulfopyruvate decarboxylase subunit alpha
MFTGAQMVELFRSVGVTHVVTVPDSTIGQWDDALAGAPGLRVVRVCREGEAWEIAAGLHLGGARPVVLIQCTGLFESGDALRNVIHDWRLPLYAIIGYRSFLNQDTLPGDTCLTFTEPIIAAWKLDCLFVRSPDQLQAIGDHLRDCAAGGRAGVTLLAEGKA